MLFRSIRRIGFAFGAIVRRNRYAKAPLEAIRLTLRTRFCGDKRLRSECFPLSPTDSRTGAQKQVRLARWILWKSLWDQ